MEPVALIVVGGLLVLLVGLFVWSGIRGFAGARVRGPRRVLDGLDLPYGLAPSVHEPVALRAAFALTGRGDVVDVGQAWVGVFRGGELGLVDLAVRMVKGGDPVVHTVVTVDVDARWPWTRLVGPGVASVAVDVPRVAFDVAGWEGVVQSRDETVARELVTPALLAWTRRAERPVIVEFTPRHLLVAAVGRVPEAELVAFVEFAVGVVDHVPAALRDRLARDVEPST